MLRTKGTLTSRKTPPSDSLGWPPIHAASRQLLGARGLRGPKRDGDFAGEAVRDVAGGDAEEEDRPARVLGLVEGDTTARVNDVARQHESVALVQANGDRMPWVWQPLCGLRNEVALRSFKLPNVPPWLCYNAVDAHHVRGVGQLQLDSPVRLSQ